MLNLTDMNGGKDQIEILMNKILNLTGSIASLNDKFDYLNGTFAEFRQGNY